MFFSYFTQLSSITQWNSAEKTVKSEKLRELECLLKDLKQKSNNLLIKFINRYFFFNYINISSEFTIWIK